MRPISTWPEHGDARHRPQQPGSARRRRRAGGVRGWRAPRHGAIKTSRSRGLAGHDPARHRRAHSPRRGGRANGAAWRKKQPPHGDASRAGASRRIGAPGAVPMRAGPRLVRRMVAPPGAWQDTRATALAQGRAWRAPRCAQAPVRRHRIDRVGAALARRRTGNHHGERSGNRGRRRRGPLARLLRAFSGASNFGDAIAARRKIRSTRLCRLPTRCCISTPCARRMWPVWTRWSDFCIARRTGASRLPAT